MLKGKKRTKRKKKRADWGATRWLEISQVGANCGVTYRTDEAFLPAEAEFLAPPR